MEISEAVVKVFSTCLREEWPNADVTPELVKWYMEQTLLATVTMELDKRDLPETLAALQEYLGIKDSDLESFEEDTDATQETTSEEREN